jgi:bacterioferritin-associated ferredoxin
MIVCVCNRLTETDVRQAARCGSATPEAAYAHLGCEVQCGCCLDYAQELIDSERGARVPLRIVPRAA